MEDPNSKEVSEILGNKTCKSIISYLTKVESASEKDLSDALKLPINTIEYNIKKLLKTSFIEKKPNFFWSKKGKKIPVYKLSNKTIILSPKKSNIDRLKSIIPAALFSVVGSFSIWVYEKINSYKIYDLAVEKTTIDNAGVLLKASSEIASSNSLVGSLNYSNINLSPHLWIYFLIGSIIAIIIISVLNWKKL